MYKNVKDTKHTRHVYRRRHFVRNVEESYLQKKVWCEGGLQLTEIGTNSFREYKLNPRLGYAIVRLDN